MSHLKNNMHIKKTAKAHNVHIPTGSNITTFVTYYP